jgi:hypothetical protein
VDLYFYLFYSSFCAAVLKLSIFFLKFDMYGVSFESLALFDGDKKEAS